MGINEKVVSKLLAAIEGARNEPASRPVLSFVGSGEIEIRPTRPPRDAMLRRIRDLRRMFRLGWLVRQETFSAGGLNDLDDEAIAQLLHRMERAKDCPVEDVSYEDAGLLRSNYKEAV